LKTGERKRGGGILRREEVVSEPQKRCCGDGVMRDKRRKTSKKIEKMFKTKNKGFSNQRRKLKK